MQNGEKAKGTSSFYKGFEHVLNDSAFEFHMSYSNTKQTFVCTVRALGDISLVNYHFLFVKGIVGLF